MDGSVESEEIRSDHESEDWTALDDDAASFTDGDSLLIRSVSRS